MQREWAEERSASRSMIRGPCVRGEVAMSGQDHPWLPERADDGRKTWASSVPRAASSVHTRRLRSLVTLVPRFILDRPHSDSGWFHGIYDSASREKRGTERTTQTGHAQPVEHAQCPEPTEDATRISKHRGHQAHWQLLLLCSRVQAAQHATRLSPTTVHALILMFRNLFP